MLAMPTRSCHGACAARSGDSEEAPAHDAAAGPLNEAMRLLADQCRPPYLRCFLGAECWYNPIPVVLAAGRSRRSGNVLGLLTAVVWT